VKLSHIQSPFLFGDASLKLEHILKGLQIFPFLVFLLDTVTQHQNTTTTL
jgi:hypothetical protein